MPKNHASHGRSANGSRHNHIAAKAPAFMVNLEDVEVEEGESFDMNCGVAGELFPLITRAL